MLDSLARFVLDLERRGHRPAFVERGRFRIRRLSYAEVGAASRRRAAALLGAGVAPGDRIVLHAAPGADWAIDFYASLLLGAVLVPLDAAYSADFVARVREHTGSRLVLGPGSPGLPEDAAMPADWPGLAATPETLLEVVYTSGTTAAPKGVTLTHGNLLANLAPIARELERYRIALRLAGRLGFVHLIPLSHLFGQVMGLFVPQLVGGTVVFAESAPDRVIAAVREERASVVVSVPQQLEALARQVTHRAALDPEQVLAGEVLSVARRWWRFRRVHRTLGLRMWAFVVGGAPLPQRLESLWSRLGFAVIQGYGLTETAPSITISHPLRMRRGTVGRRLPGVELTIAEGGEILVRGPNVTPGYYRDEAATRAAFTADGWLKTGDLGRLDAGGNLVLLGRSSDVIVLADGRNVHPEDVEEALAADRRIAECAVIGRENAGRTRVHAVLALVPGAGEAEAAAAVASANRRLEAHQRIPSWSLWREGRLPRTPIGKLKRAEIRGGLGSGEADPRETQPSSGGVAQGAIAAAIVRRCGTAAARPEARLAEDLGLSSLDRLDLLLEIEREAGAIDEEGFAAAESVGDLERLVAAARGEPAAGAASGEISVDTLQSRPGGPSGGVSVDTLQSRPAEDPRRSRLRPEPRWPAAAWAIGLRTLLRQLVVFPLLRAFVRVRAAGGERLAPLTGPVILAANHASHLDVPVIVRALPSRLRRRLAAATGTGEFRAALGEPGAARLARVGDGLKLFLVRLFFQSFLLAEGRRLRGAMAHAGWLADRGFSLLIFPEGERTADGRLLPVRPGVGVMACELGLPVIPVLVSGLGAVLPRGASWPARGEARVEFGAAIDPAGREPAAVTAELEARLQAMARAMPQAASAGSNRR